jgi:hypothetical protein
MNNTSAKIVRRFARGGYSVAMLARNQERLDALDPAIAVCVPLIWVTAWQLLSRLRRLEKGSFVFIKKVERKEDQNDHEQ